tara:strand:+ start:69 stop:347 length:279 start_codon:yes stop_codon:yes gene_type:complete
MAHRSIIRIKRNESTERAFNFCSGVIIFIILNILYYKYWYILYSVLFIILICICIYNWYKNKQKENNTTINAEIINDEVIDVTIPTIIAYEL